MLSYTARANAFTAKKYLQLSPQDNHFGELIMDVNIINPVITSMINILSTMAHIVPIAGKPELKSKNNLVQGKHITGLMNMTGPKARASIALTFPEAAILHIANKMLPQDIQRIDGLTIDLAGELANMVLGSTKGILEEKGMIFDLSLPTIIVGSEYLIAHRTDAPVIILPFSIPEGTFFVEASYETIPGTC